MYYIYIEQLLNTAKWCISCCLCKVHIVVTEQCVCLCVYVRRTKPQHLPLILSIFQYNSKFPITETEYLTTSSNHNVNFMQVTALVKVHYRIHKRPPTCPYPEPPRSIPYSHIQFHHNIILPSTPGSPKWSLSLMFPHQNPVYASPLPPIRVTCLAHLIILDLITRTIFGDDFTSVPYPGEV